MSGSPQDGRATSPFGPAAAGFRVVVARAAWPATDTPSEDTNATTTTNTLNGGESRLICSLLITYRFSLKIHHCQAIARTAVARTAARTGRTPPRKGRTG